MFYDWTAEAACTPGDTALFFGGEDGQEAAKAICGRCPVMALCRATALANGETEGVWGGLTGDELVDHPDWRRRVAPREPAARSACGTDSGYKTHRRQGEPACELCILAHREYQAIWNQRRRLAS